MTDEKTKAEIASVERRNFVKLVGTGGFTAAAVAAAAGVLGSSEASAQTAREESRRKRAAKHIMTIGTAYVLTADRSYPIMQLDFKENIQNATNGKVYVKLAAGGATRRRWSAGPEGSGRHDPGGPAFAVELCALRAGRRPSSTCPTCAAQISASSTW